MIYYISLAGDLKQEIIKEKILDTIINISLSFLLKYKYLIDILINYNKNNRFIINEKK